MSKKNASANVKKRNWAIVLYPESAPENWKDVLIETGLPCAISPLHEFDVDPNGEVKKAHYHLILCFPGPTTFNVVKSLCDSLNQPIPQPIESVKGYYRYFVHKDNPEKYQYDEIDIKTLNGFNILDYAELTRAEVNGIKSHLISVICEKDFLEYSDFVLYVQKELSCEEFDIAVNNTLFFNTFIRSRRHMPTNNTEQ